MNWIGPSRPTDDLLSTAAPLSVWELAKKQAERSPMLKFNVGAAIYDPSTQKPIASGVAHPDITRSKLCASIHAERHAVHNSSPFNIDGCWCVIYTLNGRGGCAWSGRPCYSCAQLLFKKDLERVIYAERKGAGWTIKSEHPEELIARCLKPTGPYARQQRIPCIDSVPA